MAKTTVELDVREMMAIISALGGYADRVESGIKVGEPDDVTAAKHERVSFLLKLRAKIDEVNDKAVGGWRFV